MPIMVDWDTVLSSVVIKTYSGSWTWEDFDDAERQTNDLVDASENHVDIIADLRQNVRLPSGLNVNLKRFVEALSPRIGLCVVVGPPFILELMVILAHQIPAYRERYRYAETMDIARAMIRDARDGKPPSPLLPPSHLN